MLIECRDQDLLTANAHRSTSCGQFLRYSYRHCGRCIPCLIRRAAFNHWGVADKTKYVYQKLALDDAQHARSDDVRAAGMAVADVRENGVDGFVGATLSFSVLSDKARLKDVVRRGIEELDKFLSVQKVK